MANTSIAIRSSGDTGNTPSLGVLLHGELAINYADGIIYYKTDANTLGEIKTAEPSGLDGEIQFNDSGSFGGNASLIFDKTSGTFTTTQVNAEYFIANTYVQFSDGTKQYTANAGSATVTFASSPPASGNTVGDVWIDNASGVEFMWIDDGNTSQWVEFGGIGIGVDGIPSQTGNSGKYLTTDGTTASWGTIDTTTATNAYAHANGAFDAANTAQTTADAATITASDYSSNVFIANGAGQTYTITSGHNANSTFVYYNGIMMMPVYDYTISGTTLTMTFTPTANSHIFVRYMPV